MNTEEESKQYPVQYWFEFGSIAVPDLFYYEGQPRTDDYHPLTLKIDFELEDPTKIADME
jgi:hypothetical protein